MNIVFIGPPLSGKGTQARLLGAQLYIPVFSIGKLLREAYSRGDAQAKEGYEQYAMRGKNLPISLKFHFLKEKLETATEGFILENFPSTKEDLDTFLQYLKTKNLSIDKAFLVHISEEEMQKRMVTRGRIDDTLDIVSKRYVLQGSDRLEVEKYFKQIGILAEINGEGSVEEVHKRVMEEINT
ncbi:MAG: nucleoside monophosphate kinase [Patescibacteria group bacterium]